MNENILQKLLTRVHTLEDTVSRIQENIRRTRLNTSDYFNEGKPSYESYDNESNSCVLEVAGGVDKSRSTLNSERTETDASKYKLTTCIMKLKKNWLYNTLWVIVNVIALVVSCIYIRNAYITWQSSPVVQALSNNQIHFENISFPAVTVCWPNSFRQDYDLFENIDKCTQCEKNICSVKNTTCNSTEMATLLLVRTMCSKYFMANAFPFKLFEYVPPMIDGIELDTYMEKLLPKCESDVVITKISGDQTVKKFTRCDGNMFQQFYSASSSSSVCMTFNSLQHKDIFNENVVTPSLMAKETPNLPLKEYPIWSFENMMEFKGSWNSTPIYGLEYLIILIQEQTRKHKKICNVAEGAAATVTIHSPNEIPFNEEKTNAIFVQENMVLEVYVEPKITLAREDLAQYPSDQRGCLFTHEKKLTMFKFYTKNNCDLECIVNTFLESCGCVPYMYPRQNKTVKVCLHICQPQKHRCDCLPDCNSLVYDVRTQETSIVGFEYPNVTIQAAIEIKLKGDKYYTTIRYSITSFAEFLAYCLGVLGAFLGISVTCLWKLFYFGLISFWASLKKICRKSISPLPKSRLKVHSRLPKPLKDSYLGLRKHPELTNVRDFWWVK